MVRMITRNRAVEQGCRSGDVVYLQASVMACAIARYGRVGNQHGQTSDHHAAPVTKVVSCGLGRVANEVAVFRSKTSSKIRPQIRPAPGSKSATAAVRRVAANRAVDNRKRPRGKYASAEG